MSWISISRVNTFCGVGERIRDFLEAMKKKKEYAEREESRERDRREKLNKKNQETKSNSPHRRLWLAIPSPFFPFWKQSTQEDSVGLYTDMGKKARDLLYKDYNNSDLCITTNSMARGKNLNIIFSGMVDTNLLDLGTYVSFHTRLGNFTKINLIASYTIKAYNNSNLNNTTNRSPAGSKIELNFSGVIGDSVLALGSDMTYDIESRNFNKMGLSFTKDDLTLSLAMNKNEGLFMNASYYQVLNPLSNTSVAAEVSHNFSKDITITFGARHSLGPLTSVKARVNTAGIANALIQHEWKPKSSFTISGEVNTAGIAKVGMTIAINP